VTRFAKDQSRASLHTEHSNNRCKYSVEATGIHSIFSSLVKHIYFQFYSQTLPRNQPI